MIYISSKNKTAPDKMQQILQKLLEKKYIEDTPASIDQQSKEIENWTEDAKDSMIRVLNNK